MTEQTPPGPPAPPVPPPPPPSDVDGDDALFEFTDERRYQLYIERRKRYSDVAREAYQHLHQAIIAVSAGAVVLSITFLKDVAKNPVSLGWLVASWGIHSYRLAFFALVASAEGDRERIIQIDCLARTSSCDESRADRLGLWTSRFNTAGDRHISHRRYSHDLVRYAKRHAASRLKRNSLEIGSEFPVYIGISRAALSRA